MQLSHVAIKALLICYGLIPFGLLHAKQNGDIKYIPIIVHVLYATEEQNVSIEQIKSQIDELNKDYRASNHDLESISIPFQSSYADAKIEFFLADTSFNSTENGVIRKQTNKTPVTKQALQNPDLGGSAPISPHKFLNVWVGRLADNLLGYSHSEGVTVHYTAFGTIGTALSPYNKGRTLTHEVGHFFSLKHLWGTGGCDSDDGIQDTPVQHGSINSCMQENRSCGSIDMTQNFMNVLPDDCLLFFTAGQVAKMHTYITKEKPQMHRGKVVLSSPKDHTPISIIPNPTQGIITVYHHELKEKIILDIWSVSGTFISTFQSQYGSQLDLTSLSSGLYIVYVHSQSKLFSSKLIIQ